MLCPSDLLDITNPRGLTELDKIECRLQTEASFKQWNQSSSLFLKLFTFLIGFYVSNIVSRYWDKNISIKSRKYINQDPKIYQSRPQNISIKTLKYIHQSEKIFNRWWGKVRGVPEVENPLLVLSGLAMESRFFLQFLFVCLGLFLFVFGSFLLFVNIVNGNQGAPV